MSAACPKRPARFPDSGRSGKPGFFELESTEPAIRDLNLPAKNPHIVFGKSRSATSGNSSDKGRSAA
jgi:hypothetical protein